MPSNVGIFVFNEIEVLDLAGPFEVFAVASRVQLKRDPGSSPPFEVFTVGQTVDPIQARGGLTITPRFSFASHPRIDVIIIPGGVVSAELRDEGVIHWIDQAAGHAKLIASVCTGSFLLAKTGRLDGKRATTHWEDISDLRTTFPK